MKTTSTQEPLLRFRLQGHSQEKSDACTITRRYVKGSILFRADDACEGVFVVRSGKIRLSARSRNSKTLTVRLASSGDILGVSAAIAGTPYELTAQALVASEVEHVARPEFLHLFEHPDRCFRILKVLSEDLSLAQERAVFFRSARSASARFAALLLSWCFHATEGRDGSLRFCLDMTQRDIGEIIGASRETVARLVSRFQARGIAHRRGQEFLIPDKAALELVAGTRSVVSEVGTRTLPD